MPSETSNDGQLSETELFNRLARAVTAVDRDSGLRLAYTAAWPKSTADDETRGLADDLQILGRRIFGRWSHALHALICGSDVESVELRSQIAEMSRLGPTALSSFLTAMMVSQFGVAPAVATIVALLLVRIVFQPAKEELCRYWSEKLRFNEEETSA